MDLHQPVETPIPLYCDNVSTIRLAENPVFHERTKHVDVHYHFIRESLARRNQARTCQTEDQVADLLRKGLCGSKLGSFCHQLDMVKVGVKRGVLNINSNLLENIFC